MHLGILFFLKSFGGSILQLMGHFRPYIGLLLVHSLALSINLDDLHYVSLVPARRLLQDLASGCRLGVGSLKRARRGT